MSVLFLAISAVSRRRDPEAKPFERNAKLEIIQGHFSQLVMNC